MFLEIPIKLEGYVNEIKRQTKLLDGSKNITMLQLGKVDLKDKKKIMYVIYNPFNAIIHVNCNFFTKESKVCKLYPGEFDLLPDRAYAFVAYVTGDEAVEIDENKILLDLKERINYRIGNWKEHSKDFNYEPFNIYKIDANKITLNNKNTP